MAKIQSLSGGGVDVAFEVTGIPAVLNQALHSTHEGGEVVVVSIWEGEASFQPNDLVIKERTMKGIIAYRHVYPAVMALMQRAISAPKIWSPSAFHWQISWKRALRRC
ncbi:hypothetical protein HORIV_39590 [Vreelandella olivaria]|uniref:Alcohol dehydrogenase-like C-terminal domain-containing protein n=1 Tax=Vreelandella olivaria TaxID=390919 RepID=A0ABM7GLF6_9GAMM|nr:hypothetical protein HORIV_39590 [Halomonas olivaria]